MDQFSSDGNVRDVKWVTSRMYRRTTVPRTDIVLLVASVFCTEASTYRDTMGHFYTHKQNSEHVNKDQPVPFARGSAAWVLPPTCMHLVSPSRCARAKPRDEAFVCVRYISRRGMSKNVFFFVNTMGTLKNDTREGHLLSHMENDTPNDAFSIPPTITEIIKYSEHPISRVAEHNFSQIFVSLF